MNMENLPEHLLLDILTLVPAKDLICNCQLVCSRWRDVVDLPVLWKRKYKEKDKDSSPEPLAFYILSRLKKNLIKNPDGQDGLDSWEIQTPAEGHWETEELSMEESKSIHNGPYTIGSFSWTFERVGEDDAGEDDAGEDAPVESSSCFAARNGPCSKSQLITLKDEGYWDELMDEVRPPIVVKDSFACEPGSCYKLTVKLLSANSEVLIERQYEEVGLSCWYPFSHTFWNYPQGVRLVLFEHKVHKEIPEPNVLELFFPEIGPEPPWGRMRVLQSSITLLPSVAEEDDIDDYDDPYTCRDF